MSVNPALQYFTNTQSTGQIYNTSTANNTAASTATKVTYPALGVGVRKFIPGSTSSAAATIPSSRTPGTTRQGWATAQVSDERIKPTEGQTWPCTIRVDSSSSLTLAITVIAYVVGDGGTIEIGRGTSTATAVTAAQSKTLDITMDSDLSSGGGYGAASLHFEVFVTASGLNTNALSTTTVSIHVGGTSSQVDPNLIPEVFARTGSDVQAVGMDVASRTQADFRRSAEMESITVDSAQQRTAFARFTFESVDQTNETPLPSSTFRRTSAPQVVEYIAETAQRLSVNFRRSADFIDMMDVQAVRGTVNYRRTADDAEQMVDVALKQITYGRAVRYSSSAGDTDPLTDPTKFITGVIRNCDGTPYTGNALVILFRDDDIKVAQTVSGGDGSYSFPRNSFDTASYYVAAFIQGAQPRQSVTERGLVPV